MDNSNEGKQNEMARQLAMLSEYFNSNEWQQQAQQLKEVPMPKYRSLTDHGAKEDEINMQVKKLQDYFDSEEWKSKQVEMLDERPKDDNVAFVDIELAEREIQLLQERLEMYKARKQQKESPISADAELPNSYIYSKDSDWRQQEQAKEIAMRIKQFKKPNTKRDEDIERALDSVNNYFKSEAWTAAQQNTENASTADNALAELPNVLYSANWYN